MDSCGTASGESAAPGVPGAKVRNRRGVGVDDKAAHLHVDEPGRHPAVLALSAQQGGSIGIQVVGQPMPQGLLVHYATPADDAPKSFHNCLYAWDTTSNQVPWDKPPIGKAPINSDSSTGTERLSFDYEQKGYIVGYAVGDPPVAVSATVYLPQGSSRSPTEWEYAATQCQVVYADSNVVQIQYTDLTAYRPNTNQNWVGVWAGSSVPYQGAPLGLGEIGSDADSGYAVVEGLNLSVSTAYCVGYFVVGGAVGRTSLAAWASFSVESR